MVLVPVLLSGCLATALLPEEEEPRQPEAPSMPDAARARTDAGAEAFVRHYLAVEDYAVQTGDLGPLQMLVSPSCRGCAHVVFTARTVDRVGRVEGGARSVDQLREMPTADGADWTGRVTGQVDESVFRSGEGGELKRYVGGPYTLDIDLTWVGAGWLVTERTDLG